MFIAMDFNQIKEKHNNDPQRILPYDFVKNRYNPYMKETEGKGLGAIIYLVLGGSAFLASPIIIIPAILVTTRTIAVTADIIMMVSIPLWVVVWLAISAIIGCTCWYFIPRLKMMPETFSEDLTTNDLDLYMSGSRTLHFWRKDAKYAYMIPYSYDVTIVGNYYVYGLFANDQLDRIDKVSQIHQYYQTV